MAGLVTQGLATRALGAMGFQWRGKAERRSGVPVHVRGTANSALWGELSEPTLYSAQAERYTTSDLVYMCVNRIAEMAAMNAHRLTLFDPDSPRDPETGFPTVVIDDHPFLDLYRKPNPWDSTFEFMEATLIFTQVNGNSYWHADDGNAPIQRGGQRWVMPEGEPLNLWVLRPDRLWIQPDHEKYISAYRYEVGGEITYIHPDLIRHYKRFHPLRDFEGLSPMEPANFAVASDIASQRSNWSLYRNSMRLSGVVEGPEDTMDEDQIQLMEKEMKEKYTGSPDKWHQVAFLWSGFKYKELGMNMKDADFINAQKMNRMRIFGVWGVHPAVVLSEDVNLANAKIGEYVTLKYTVSPMLERIASDASGLFGLWKDAPPAEAHFVGVVPQDKESEATMAEAKARATEGFIRALGNEEGIAEAQRQGVLSEDVDARKVFAVPALPAPKPAIPAETEQPQSVKTNRLNLKGVLDDLGARVDGALGMMRMARGPSASVAAKQQPGEFDTNFQSGPVNITVQAPMMPRPILNVTVPEIRVPPSEITVNIPEQKVQVVAAPPTPVQLTLLPPDGVERVRIVRDAFGNIAYTEKEYLPSEPDE